MNAPHTRISGIPNNAMTHNDLCAVLDGVAMDTLRGVRYLPTGFGTDARETRAFPYGSRRWQSGVAAFAALSSSAVMVRLPLVWQMHTIVHDASRANGAIVYVNALNNPRLGLAAIRSIGIDTIVSGRKAAELFAHDLVDSNILHRMNWLVVLDPADDWTLSDSILSQSKGVACEVHLFPGLPLLWQCAHLVRERKLAFHATEDLEWVISTEAACVSGCDPVQLRNYILPFSLQDDGICECGKPRFRRNGR